MESRSKRQRPKQTGADDYIVPLAAEEARIAKRQVTSGRVRVRTVVDPVEELAKATLESESVDVVRVPIDREVNHPPSIRSENGTTIIPILEEVLVIEKKLVLKEELHVRRRVSTEKVEAPVTLRKQRAIIERLPAKARSQD